MVSHQSNSLKTNFFVSQQAVGKLVAFETSPLLEGKAILKAETRSQGALEEIKKPSLRSYTQASGKVSQHIKKGLTTQGGWLRTRTRKLQRYPGLHSSSTQPLGIAVLLAFAFFLLPKGHCGPFLAAPCQQGRELLPSVAPGSAVLLGDKEVILCALENLRWVTKSILINPSLSQSILAWSVCPRPAHASRSGVVIQCHIAALELH